MENIIDCKTILTQEHPTGHEVGLLLFASILNTMEERIHHKKVILPYTQKQFDNALSKLTTEQYNTYLPYRYLYNSIIAVFNEISDPYLHNVIEAFLALINEIRYLCLIEGLQGAFYVSPLVVTKQEYDQLYQQTVERLQREGNNNEPTHLDLAQTIKGEQETEESYYRYHRALYGIVTPQFLNRELLDPSGKYDDFIQETALKNAHQFTTVRKNTFKEIFDAIRKGISFNYSFISLMAAIEKVYKIPCLHERLTIQHICHTYEINIKEYNNKIRDLCLNVCGSEHLQREKIKCIVEVFPELNIEDFKPTAQQITEIEKTLSDIGYNPSRVEELKDLHPFINTLMKKAD